MTSQVKRVEQALDALRPPGSPDDVLQMPPSPEEQRLLDERETLQSGLARIRFFGEAEDQEWAVRYPPEVGARLELVPLSVRSIAPALLWDAAELIVLSSAYLGRREVLAEHFGLTEERMRTFSSDSPFALEQRPIVYRPVGRLSKATLSQLEPTLFAEIAAVLARHATDKGLIHAASYASARRLVQALAERAPLQSRRLIFIDTGIDRTAALELHRATREPTVLLSPSLREGVDLPDDFLRFQIITKLPYPDLGDPWTAARRMRDPRWYAFETAKALVQAYGRSCRHAGDHGTTYILDGQFERFVASYQALLPAWFLETAVAALRQHRRDLAD
jgi:Rad3-related DNA helicase